MKANKGALPATLENDTNVDVDIKQRFTLKNKSLYDKMSTFDEETAAEEAKKQMIEYKRSRGLAPDTKIFKILGKYFTLREEFERRGWVEHDWEEIQDRVVEENFNSLAFDFLYTRQGKDVFRMPLAPH